MSNGRRKPVKPVVRAPKTRARRIGEWLKRQAEEPWFGIERGPYRTGGLVPRGEAGAVYGAMPRRMYEAGWERFPWEEAGAGGAELLGGAMGWPEAMVPAEPFVAPEWYGGAATYYSQAPWDVSETQWGETFGPYGWGQQFGTVRPDQLGTISALNRARLTAAQPVPGEETAGLREAAGQARLGQATAPAEIGARGAPMRPGARIPGMSSLATGAWWNAFTGVHGVAPQEFYMRPENRKPGMSWQQSADYDLAFADAIRRRNVRKGSGNVGPSPGEWANWYYQSRGWRQPPKSQIKAREAQMMRETGWI